MKLNILMVILFAGIITTNIDAQKQVTKEDYDHASSMLYGPTSKLVDRMGVRPRWKDNGQFWYSVKEPKGIEYVLIDPKTKKRTVHTSNDEIKDKTEKKELHPNFSYRTSLLSPDRTKAAFIREWNLWILDMNTGEENQVTQDGIENYGYATDNAGWRKSERPILLWSPDSKKIATYQQDQRHVSDMFLVKTEVGGPRLNQWKYPLPEDEEIIKIERVIIDLELDKVIRLKMDADPRRGTLCDDISCDSSFDDNQWSDDGSRLIFVSSSRDHKVAQLREANTATGDVRDIHREEVATQYESGQGSINWTYLEKRNEFIWYSEKDNWGHLYLHDFKTGKVKNQITKGDFVVTRVIKVDKKNKKIFFMANGLLADPYFSQFCSVDFSGKNFSVLTPENANHSITISKDGKYFVDNYSTPDTPPISVLRDIKGKMVMTLEKADISRLLNTGWKPPTPITVKSDNEKYDLFGLMFLPSNKVKGEKYPVVNYVYPGPQGGGVGSRSFRPSRSDHQALAELGFVVVVIDGTCNPGRSKAFHDECYGNMSINTLPDQISGIKQLAEKFDFIDATKVGIWGHSGGGFATASALLKYPEFYSVGISESGNHDNRNYEDDWGERYNGMMKGIKNGTVDYEAQANQSYAENLKGKLMIAHGAMDDNVPVSNSYLLVDALIKANKDFDLVIFPNARHGFGQDSYYMMRKRWDYFVTHLQGKIPPKEYKVEYVRDNRGR